MRRPRTITLEWIAEHSEPEPNTGCWLWSGSCWPSGYARTYAMGRRWTVNRLVWTVIHGELPAEIFVCHRCDVPSCVNPAHLFLGTHRDNMDDKMRKGRVPRGETAGRAKLTESDVRSIREQIAQGCSIRALARARRISPGTIHAIKNGTSWRHLP